MNRPTPAQVEGAWRLLQHEGDDNPESGAVAAARVYDKVHAHLDPILGAAGVQALLVRSAKLTHAQHPFLEASILDSSTKLREALQAQPPAAAGDAASMLFATFLRLLSTFIGARLTTQVLRSAWPTITDIAPSETPR